MSSEYRYYIKITVAAALLVAALSLYPVYKWYGMDYASAAFVALCLTFLNAVVGFYYIDKYFSASLNDFMKMVFGSMGVRLFVLAVLLVALLGFTKIHKVSFTVSLFISYILFSVIEIYFLNKKASKPDTKS